MGGRRQQKQQQQQQASLRGSGVSSGTGLAPPAAALANLPAAGVILISARLELAAKGTGTDVATRRAVARALRCAAVGCSSSLSGPDQYNFVMHPVFAAKKADPDGNYASAQMAAAARGHGAAGRGAYVREPRRARTPAARTCAVMKRGSNVVVCWNAHCVLHTHPSNLGGISCPRGPSEARPWSGPAPAPARRMPPSPPCAAPTWASRACPPPPP